MLRLWAPALIRVSWPPHMRVLQSHSYAPSDIDSYESMDYEEGYQGSDIFPCSATEDSVSQADGFSEYGLARSWSSSSCNELFSPTETLRDIPRSQASRRRPRQRGPHRDRLPHACHSIFVCTHLQPSATRLLPHQDEETHLHIQPVQQVILPAHSPAHPHPLPQRREALFMQCSLLWPAIQPTGQPQNPRTTTSRRKALWL